MNGRMGRPDVCAYCDGTGRTGSPGGQNECGFCDGGIPLDTQEDWDRTWGKAYLSLCSEADR